MAKKKKSDTFTEKVSSAFKEAAQSGLLGTRRKIVETTMSDAEKKAEAKKRKPAR